MRWQVAAGGVLLMVAGCSSSHPTSAPKAPALSSERAQQISAAFHVGSSAAVASVVALPRGTTLQPSVLVALSHLEVSFEVSTFHVLSASTATVEAVVRSGAAGHPRSYQVGLDLVGGKWLVNTTSLSSP
jgi:hypothetical protein